MQADQLAIRLKEGSCIDNDGVGHPPTEPLVINARLFRIGILSSAPSQFLRFGLVCTSVYKLLATT